MAATGLRDRVPHRGPRSDAGALSPAVVRPRVACRRHHRATSTPRRRMGVDALSQARPVREGLSQGQRGHSARQDGPAALRTRAFILSAPLCNAAGERSHTHSWMRPPGQTIRAARELEEGGHSDGATFFEPSRRRSPAAAVRRDARYASGTGSLDQMQPVLVASVQPIATRLALQRRRRKRRQRHPLAAPLRVEPGRTSIAMRCDTASSRCLAGDSRVRRSDGGSARVVPSDIIGHFDPTSTNGCGRSFASASCPRRAFARTTGPFCSTRRPGSTSTRAFILSAPLCNACSAGRRSARRVNSKSGDGAFFEPSRRRCIRRDAATYHRDRGAGRSIGCCRIAG